MSYQLKKTLDEIRKVKAIITTEEGGDGGADAGSDEGGGDAGGDSGADGDADSLDKLFTPEEVTAKKESLATIKAEEERRAALTDEERTAEDALKAEAEAKNVVPEKYTSFKLPDGTEPDAETFEKWGEFAKAKGFTQAQMEEFTNEGMKFMNEARQKQFDGIKAGWLDTAQKDKEIGEDVKKGKDSVAARAFSTIATPEMKSLMDDYGLGNHPEVLRMFFRLSKFMGEDGFDGNTAGAGLGAETGTKALTGSIFNHPSRQKG